ncbi:hypothetical protein JCM24511_03068 [Saitozyma sp. JCM 24511]|nr:hypothetical protein JCM24511_03068 [Saitozyma sp. JCM 24511]
MSAPPHKPESVAEAVSSGDSASTTLLRASSSSASREDAWSRLLARLSITTRGPANSESTIQKTDTRLEFTTEPVLETPGQSAKSSTPEADVKWGEILSRHAQHKDKWNDLRDWFINQDLSDADRLITVRTIFGLFMTNLKLSELADIPTEGEYEHERLQLISAIVTYLNLPIEKLSLDGERESEGAPLLDILEPREVLGPFVRAVYTVSRAASEEEEEEKRELLRSLLIRQGGEWLDDWPSVRVKTPQLLSELSAALPTDAIASL